VQRFKHFRRRGVARDSHPQRYSYSLPSRARERLGGAMPTDLLDLLGPPGWCSGCWPHDGEVAGGAVASSF
jgi:hypothetical protein